MFVADLLRRHRFTVEDEQPYLEIHRSPDLLIQRFLWPPNHSTPAHDHRGVWAFLSIIGGSEENTLYRPEGEPITFASSREHSSGAVVSLGPEAFFSAVAVVDSSGR